MVPPQQAGCENCGLVSYPLQDVRISDSSRQSDAATFPAQLRLTERICYKTFEFS